MFIDHSATWNPSELLRLTTILSKKCTVAINGAETLLYPEFLDSYQAAGQNFVFSNGLVFLQNNAKILMQKLRDHGVTTIRLSNHFQASDALHAVSADTVEYITRLLQQNGFIVHYNSTVTCDNYKYIAENCHRSSDLGVKRIKFFPLKLIGKAKRLNLNYRLTFSQMEQFYATLVEQRKQFDISVLDILISGDLAGITNRFHCTFGKRMYAVTPDMNLYGCLYSISNIPPIGHLEKDGTIVIDHEIKHDCSRCLL